MKKIIYLLLLLTLTSFVSQAFAHDTDIYVLDQSMEQVPPDALIVLDLSGSMRFTPAGPTMYVPGTNCSIDGPFYPASGTGHTHACNDLSQTSGPIYGDSLLCGGPFYKNAGTKTLNGHSINFSTNCSRVAIAKRGIFRFLDADESGTINAADEDTLKMRMGYMRFYNCGNYTSESGTNYTAGCNTLIKSINTHYSDIYCNSGTSCTQSSSSSGSVSGETGTGGTALAHSLSEAKLYLNWTKDPSRDDAWRCRQKFVILLTDGEDTVSCSGTGNINQSDDYKRRRETVAKAKALADAGYLVFVLGFGADMPHYLENTLNWAAYYGGTDNPGVVNSITSMYSITSESYYPSGITGCQTSSTSHHNLGEGDHYYATSNDPGEKGISGYAFLASDATQLRDAIDAIRNYIIAILARSTSYVAPVVPISQMEKTSSGNRMYLGMFKPTLKSFWKGNIKKYGIATEDTETIKIGDIIDAKTPPELVMGSGNKISDSAKSYWSSVVDKGEVDMGGVGEKLLARNLTTDPRKIYTYLGTNANLTDSSNAFALSNAAITTTKLAVSTTTERDDIIKFVRGLDAWDWNKNEIFDEKRDWILGAFIHSRPLVIHYSDRSVIYAGANDGMLHAFDDATGEELWGFIPPNLLPNLKKFKDELSLQLFVDGSPKAYEGTSQTVLIFGERRGGERYIALDVTSPLSPRFLWEISSSRTGYEEIGQTWSTPRIGKIKDGLGEKWVAFISGGYDDTHQDPQPSLSPPDAKGTAIYVVDIPTGDLIWKYSRSIDSAMNYSIPSDIARVDTNGDGYIDRLYVGDMGGRIWRFDIGDVNETASWTGKIIFTGNGKIFYPPDVTLEKDSVDYEMIFFGTGDRENPKDASFISRLYAVKDKDPDTPLTESNLIDVTLDLLQDPSTPNADKIALMNDLKTHDGWYIRLNQNSGEKCLAESVVFGGVAYYTTFTFTPGGSDVCLVGDGQGRIYALKYKTGNAAFNLDVNNDLKVGEVVTKVINREDRLLGIGTGIPSGVILTVIGDTVTGYAGVAGGVYSPLLSSTRAIVPTNWRIVF